MTKGFLRHIWDCLGHAFGKGTSCDDTQDRAEAMLQRGERAVQMQQDVFADYDRFVNDLRESNRQRESGIWPQDMIRGTYRVNRRKVRRGHS